MSECNNSSLCQLLSRRYRLNNLVGNVLQPLAFYASKFEIQETMSQLDGLYDCCFAVQYKLCCFRRIMARVRALKSELSVILGSLSQLEQTGVSDSEELSCILTELCSLCRYLRMRISEMYGYYVDCEREIMPECPGAIDCAYCGPSNLMCAHSAQ